MKNQEFMEKIGFILKECKSVLGVSGFSIVDINGDIEKKLIKWF